jgi:hypothetical protein
MSKHAVQQILLFFLFFTYFCRVTHSDEPQITWINPLPTGNDLNCAASNGITTVVGGTGGLIMSTSDFKKWRFHYTYQNGIVQILWTGKEFLARCADKAVLYSTDGSDWNVMLDSRFAPANIKDLHCKNGKIYMWLSERLYTCSDRKTWIPVRSENNSSFQFIFHVPYFTGSVWYYFGVNRFFKSIDCIDWVMTECKDDFEEQHILSVKPSYDTLFGLSEKNIIKYFTGDLTWTMLHNGECKQSVFKKKPELFDFVKLGNTFIAIDYQGKIARSISNSPWEVIYDKQEETFLKIVQLDKKQAIVLGKNGCMVLYQKNMCINLKTSFVDQSLNCGTAAAKVNVIAGDSGVIFSTDTAGNLIKRVTPIIDNFKHTIWADSEFIVLGSKKAIRSTDGISWEPLADLPCDIEDVLYMNSKLYAVGSCILSSSNGRKWDNHGYYNYLWEAICASETKIVTAGSCNSIAEYSKDSDWKLSSQKELCLVRDMIWSGKKFIVLSQDDLHISPDGRTWKNLGFSRTKYAANWRFHNFQKLFQVDSFTISPCQHGLAVSSNAYDWYIIALPFPSWNVTSFIKEDTIFFLSAKGGLFKIENIKSFLRECYSSGSLKRINPPESYLDLNIESGTMLEDSLGRIKIKIEGAAIDSNAVICTWSRFNESYSKPYQSDLIFKRNDSVFVSGRVLKDSAIYFEKPYLLLYDSMKVGDTWRSTITVDGAVLDSFKCIVERSDSLEFYGDSYLSKEISFDNGNLKILRCFSKGIGLVSEKTYIRDTLTSKYRLLNDKKLRW